MHLEFSGISRPAPFLLYSLESTYLYPDDSFASVILHYKTAYLHLSEVRPVNHLHLINSNSTNRRSDALCLAQKMGNYFQLSFNAGSSLSFTEIKTYNGCPLPQTMADCCLHLTPSNSNGAAFLIDRLRPEWLEVIEIFTVCIFSVGQTENKALAKLHCGMRWSDRRHAVIAIAGHFNIDIDKDGHLSSKIAADAALAAPSPTIRPSTSADSLGVLDGPAKGSAHLWPLSTIELPVVMPLPRTLLASHTGEPSTCAELSAVSAPCFCSDRGLGFGAIGSVRMR